MPSARWLIWTKKRRGTKINPWETSALTPIHEETGLKTVNEGTGSLKISLYFLYFQTSDKTLSSLSEMLFCFSLYEACRKLYQTKLRKNISEIII